MANGRHRLYDRRLPRARRARAQKGGLRGPRRIRFIQEAEAIKLIKCLHVGGNINLLDPFTKYVTAAVFFKANHTLHVLRLYCIRGNQIRSALLAGAVIAVVTALASSVQDRTNGDSSPVLPPCARSATNSHCERGPIYLSHSDRKRFAVRLSY